ncbi:MAG: CBS domain-containing protein [Gaiellales bacterium]
MNVKYQRGRHETVASTMSRHLLTASESDAMVDAARRMAERRVGAILVMDGDRLAGIMTERDVLRAVGAGRIDGTVGDWMTRDPITVDSHATHGEAAMMMIHGGFRHVPIVDSGKLVGIVSIRDLLLLPSSTPSGV